VAFRFIAANNPPDHDTIATFRRRFLPQLNKLFAQILLIAHQMEVLKLGNVSLDGSKIKAEVACLLKKAEAADRADIPDGMNIPEELERRKKRLLAIAAAKAEIEKRAAERHAREQAAYEKKVAERAKKEQATGKKAKGKEPKPPNSGPTAKDQVNLTDDESRIMPTSGGGFEQAYNTQAGVDTASKLIVSDHVTQNPNDKQELTPTLENLAALPEKLGKTTELVADSGYFSETNVTACEENGIPPYIAVDRQSHNPPLMERFAEPPPLPEDADSVARMKHRLKTPSGKAIYAQRKVTLGPVFGVIKAVMGFRSFLLRGFEAVKGEWNLICMAYNIKRLHALGRID